MSVRRRIAITILIFLFIPTSCSIYLFRLPCKMFFNSVYSTAYLSKSIMADIREDLHSQSEFIKKLDNHQGPAKRYLHRTPLTIYTTVDFGMYDVYATYINENREWAVRLGIYPDKNAESFFPQQVGGLLGKILGLAIKLGNWGIEIGIFKPMLYHITDKPETSFVSDSYQPVPNLVN